MSEQPYGANELDSWLRKCQGRTAGSEKGRAGSASSEH